MPRIHLTDLSVRALKPPPSGQSDFWDASTRAFGVRISQGGAKTFVVKKNNRRITLGRYPDLPLAKARSKAKTLLAEPATPTGARMTFQEAVDAFITTYSEVRHGKGTQKEIKRLLKRHFTFKRALDRVTRHDIQEVLDSLKNTPSEANHAFKAIRTFFRWAMRRDYITINPVANMQMPAKSTRRTRILSDAELLSIWRACEQTQDQTSHAEDTLADGSNQLPRLPAHFDTIVKLLIVTGLRRTECASLRTSFVEGATATLPAELVKNKTEFTFPLPALALEILRDIDVDTTRNDALFFPARGKPKKPFNGWSKAMVALRKLLGEDFKHFTLHDIRRTYRTTHAKIGTPPHIAERLVNHISSRTDVEKIYDLHRYLPEMAAAVSAHEAHLKGLLQLA